MDFVWDNPGESIQIVGVSACVIFILHQNIQKMANYTFGLSQTKSCEL